MNGRENKSLKPQKLYKFVHVTSGGKIFKKNIEIIGKDYAGEIIRKVMKINKEKASKILDNLKDNEQTIIFGLGIETELAEEIWACPNAFFLSGKV